MHTMRVDSSEHGEIIVNHNGDWSGTVRVKWNEQDQVKEVWLPGVVLLAVGLEAMKDKVKSKLIAILEDW